MHSQEQEIMEIILGIKNDDNRKSTLQLALECARRHCGIKENQKLNSFDFAFRNNLIEDCLEGNPIRRNSEEADVFASLLLYLNCLEQIGTLFYNDNNTKNGIKKALNHHFPIMHKDKKDALKCLRHSLAHSFGMVNIDLYSQKPTYKFCLHFSENNNNIVEIPKNKWNGDYADKSNETSTHIYIFNVINMVETIIKNVKEEYNNGTLSFILPIEQVISRFTIII